MKRFFLILLTVVAATITMATRAETIQVKEAPVDINLPKGFSFMGANATRDFLMKEYGANDVDAYMSHMIGLIYPDSLLSADRFDGAWILSYINDGYVKDSQAGEMDFKWILESLRRDNPTVKFQWAWYPRYDTKRHFLSIPMVHITTLDTTVNIRQLKFGKEGYIQIEPVVSMERLKWLYDNDYIVADGVNFREGSRHEDFDPSKDHASYQSVYGFLQGLKGASVTEPANEEEYYSKREETSWWKERDTSFMMWCGIIAVVLTLALIFLITCVWLTNKKTESSRDITIDGINVLLRTGVFWIVYLLFILLAVVLVWLGIKVSIGMAGYINRLTLALLFIMWAIIGLFAITIVVCLFKLTEHTHNPIQIEITQNDTPELFSLIESAAKETGKEMPGKVFLVPEVMAAVSYQHPFKSIFFTGKKNLTLGVALMYGLNRSELKAIISHEYGHFRQESARIQPAVVFSMNVISNYEDSSLTDLVVGPILRIVARYVLRGHMRLSRAMEYDADETSAKIAGGSVLVSSLWKTDLNEQRFDAFNKTLQRIAQYKKILPVTLWKGYGWFIEEINAFDGTSYDETDLIDCPLIKAPKSRVKLKNPWLSHPEIEERATNLKDQSVSPAVIDFRKALDLIPESILNRLSNAFYGTNQAKRTDKEEYVPLMLKDLEEQTFPLYLRPFLSRPISMVDFDGIEESTPKKTTEEIFTSSNMDFMREFAQAVADYHLLVAFQNKETSEKRIRYDGVVYTRKNVPVERQEERVRIMEQRAHQLDMEIALLALSMAEDKSQIVEAYSDIQYGEQVVGILQTTLLPEQEIIRKSLGYGGEKTQEQFDDIVIALSSYKRRLSQLVFNQLEMSRLTPVMHVEMVDYFDALNKLEFDTGDPIDGGAVNYLFSVPFQLLELFNNLVFFSKKLIADTIDRKPLTLYWNNSVAQHELKDKK